MLETYQANTKIASLFNYPIHLGITATGLGDTAIVKSSLGIGSLLLNGIGDTIRVSLTQDPLQEVKVAKEILSALELRKFGPEIISCPGCSRANIDILKISKKLTGDIKKIGSKLPLKIAIMGCEVNGPGEARNSDIGIAGGKNCAVLFKRGKIIKRLSLKEIKKEFMYEVKTMLKEQK